METETRWFSGVIPFGGMLVSLLAVLFIAYGSYRQGQSEGIAHGRELEQTRIMRTWGDVRPPDSDH